MNYKLGCRFPPPVIMNAVWLYARFTLSFRDVEETLAERGVDASNETVRCWFLKFGRLIASHLRRPRPPPSLRWHLDEMGIKVRGRRHWLWRAADGKGEVLDFLVQPRRFANSARRLLRTLLKQKGFAPKRITIDKPRSYAAAIRTERLSAVHNQGLRANNRAENSHQPNASSRSKPPSKTPSPPSAISADAASSSSSGRAHSRCGGRVRRRLERASVGNSVRSPDLTRQRRLWRLANHPAAQPSKIADKPRRPPAGDGVGITMLKA